MLPSVLLLALLATRSTILCSTIPPPNGDECSNLQESLSEANITEKVFTNQRFRYWERPVLNANESIEVSIRLFLRSVADVDEKRQQVKLAGYLMITWFDEVHVWNETKLLNCIQDMVVPHGEKTELWIPDVAFTSAGDKKYELTRSPVELVRLRSDGYAIFTPGSIFEFQCDFNLAMFPFDYQTCTLTFETWAYQVEQQHFADNPEVSLEDLHKTEHEEWRLIGCDAHYRRGQYTFGDYDWVEFEVTLQRKTGYYALTIILPCLLIAAVEIFTFAIPFDKTVRLEVSFTCLLAYSVFQSVMTSEMPHSADNPPLLLLLIGLLTIYIAIAICAQSFVLLLVSKAKDRDKVPIRLLYFVDCFAPFCGIRRIFLIDAVSSDEVEADGIEPTPPAQTLVTNEAAWIHIARIIDRLGCFFFTFLLVVTSCIMLLVIPAAANKRA